jgi:predicted transcriptional regulator
MKPEPVVLARLRSDLLDAMWLVYPQALSLDQLESKVRIAYLTRPTSWLATSIREQLAILNQARLIRPSSKGYLLTEAGRRDRQQAARFLGPTNNQPTPPPEAA